ADAPPRRRRIPRREGPARRRRGPGRGGHGASSSAFEQAITPRVGYPLSMIQAVTFDVTHTLIHTPHLGEIYAEVLRRHHVDVDPPAARRLVGEVWQEFACSADPGLDRFAAHPEGERGWWRRFLERMCEHLEAPVPSRFAAAELFHRFGTAAAWEVYPEVPEVLEALVAQGLRLGVVSNWHHHLLPADRGGEAGLADLPPGPGRAGGGAGRRRARGGRPTGGRRGSGGRGTGR